jgi:hypothetical protein
MSDRSTFAIILSFQVTSSSPHRALKSLGELSEPDDNYLLTTTTLLVQLDVNPATTIRQIEHDSSIAVQPRCSVIGARQVSKASERDDTERNEPLLALAGHCSIRL